MLVSHLEAIGLLELQSANVLTKVSCHLVAIVCTEQLRTLFSKGLAI